MNLIQNVLQAILLKDASLQNIAQNEKFNTLSNLANLALGVAYGLFTILINYDYIQSFQTEMLRTIFIPLFFITSGIIMMFITKVGFMFLLWAGSRAFGGPGLMRVLNRMTGFILIPGVFALPAFVHFSKGSTPSVIALIAMIFALVWIYMLAVKSLIVSQNLAAWKAYIAVIAVFTFFTSVYYLVIPPAS
ncbi:hypothetical protein LC040_12715 [Bacillus tianshenii]|nr:hypothetical protein LC040_12715 [Bacillus tianshenii]